MDQKNNNNKRPKNGKGSNWRGLMSLVSWALLLTVLFSIGGDYMTGQARHASSVEIQYSDFRQMVKEEQVSFVGFDNEEAILIIEPADGYTYADEANNIHYVYDEANNEYAVYIYSETEGKYVLRDNEPVQLELFTVKVETNDAVIAFLDEYGVTDYTEDYQAPMSGFTYFLVQMLPLIFSILAITLIMGVMAKKGMGGMGGIGGVGKANAKVYMEKSTGVTFKDVAGQDEAKESLTEIIDFLHNPGKYTEIGAKLPKGALLVGPPGTGKTLLAKAVAGEANVPFFSISGSDFVEMFVGVGASRVRDLFKEANKVAPCIVFIDEIDTIGKSRDNRMGGNDEREQTLNQLLAEMDGFDPTKGVILLAATNRPEVLDQALLRPGRFDRRITIDRPNLAGRIATLQVHTRNIKLAEDVNLKKVALATAGCVGADLANLVNEAALRAVRKGRKRVTQEDLLAAFELVIAGTE